MNPVVVWSVTADVIRSIPDLIDLSQRLIRAAAVLREVDDAQAEEIFRRAFGTET